MNIGESEILKVLLDIETGQLGLEPVDTQFETYSGNVVYDITNGWQITIFKDANNWDYIDNIKTRDGENIDFDKLDCLQSIKNYYPTKEACLKIYKMGYEDD